MILENIVLKVNRSIRCEKLTKGSRGEEIRNKSIRKINNHTQHQVQRPQKTEESENENLNKREKKIQKKGNGISSNVNMSPSRRPD